MRKRSKAALPLPRYIDASSVDEGDVIRVAWKAGDVTHSREGKVARIVNGTVTKQFISPDGNMIAEIRPSAPKVRVTLLDEGDKALPVALFSVEDLRELVNDHGERIGL